MQRTLLSLILLFISPVFAEDSTEESADNVKWEVSSDQYHTREINIDTTETTWSNVTVSADGKTVVFDMLGDIFSVSMDGGEATALTHGIEWNYLYWYQLPGGSQDFLEAKLARADALGTVPVVTHYQLLDRGREAGYSGAEEWDVVIQAVQDDAVIGGVDHVVRRLDHFGAEDDQTLVPTTEDGDDLVAGVLEGSGDWEHGRDACTATDAHAGAELFDVSRLPQGANHLDGVSDRHGAHLHGRFPDLLHH